MKKIKTFLKIKLELFKHSPKKQKIIVVSKLLFSLYLLWYSAQVLSSSYNFKKEMAMYDMSKHKALQEKMLDPKSTMTLKDAIKTINKKKIEAIEFRTIPDKPYTDIMIVLKDDFAFKHSQAIPFSIATNIEPLLMKENIPYAWTSSAKFSNKMEKPERDQVEFIPPFIKEHMLMILIYGLIIYFLIRSMPGLGKKKFDIIWPSEVKGSISDLVGMDPEIKKEILQLKDLITNIERYGDYGVSGVFNIAFSGPPGTGKSRTAMYLAKELSLPMVIGTGNVETGLVGGGANTIRDIFEAAENLAYESPHKTAIIFMDEAQALFVKRGSSREKWADDSANELLAQLDGVSSMRDLKIIFIAASNFDDSNMVIDEAMERRFQKKIYFRMPGLIERKEIIKYYIDKIDVALRDQVDIDHMAKLTGGMSPAKLESIIKEAALLAIREEKKITTEILFKAFERIAVGSTNRDDSKTDRERIILHELGHFICEFDRYYKTTQDLDKIKEKMNFLKISSESIAKVGALGYVLNADTEEKLKTRTDIEEEIIALYGGFAAESVYFSNNTQDLVSTGAFNDIEKISRLLKLVVIDMGMYSKSKVNFGLIGLKNDEAFVVEIDQIAERLYEEAISRVLKHKDLINHIKPEIVKHWVLSKDELFDIISKIKIEGSV